MTRSTASILLAAVLVILVVVGVGVPRPPSVVPADAPPDQFSAERAHRHVEAIAREPHAMGTAEHARVRDYVAGQLRALGVEPEVHEAVVALAEPGSAVFGRPINVLGRLTGKNGGGEAVLLVSHYDTVHTSPGAGDDSSGVATMLETLRALRQGPQLANDVIFLFSDGEEPGLLGAHSFMEHHPWAKEVGVVLNFEARGSTGASLMFETSAGNAPLVGALDHAMAHPAAASYSYEVYRRMPNDTDYSVFRRAGTAGLNFAFIGGGTAYHTAQDSLGRLDPRSLQQHGEAALSLTRLFAEADLTRNWETRDAVYFNLPGNVLVRYSTAWAVPLAVAIAVAALLVIVVGFRRGKMTAGGFVGGLVAVLLGTAVVAVVTTFASGFFMRFYNFVLWNGWTSVSLNFLGISLAAVGATIIVAALLRKMLRAENLFAAGLLIWVALAVAVSVVAPGGSYLFCLPLAAAVAAGALWVKQEDSHEKVSVPLVVLLLVSAAVTAFLWSPTLGLLGLALGGAAAVVAGAMIPLLLFGPLMPNLAATFPVKGRSPWLSSVVLIVLALAVIVAVSSASRFSEDNRRLSSLFYFLDTETGTAEWMSLDRTVDEWTSKYLSESPESRPRPFMFTIDGTLLANDAPAIDREGATVEWLGEEDGDDGPRVSVHLDWPFDVHRAVLVLESDTRIRSVSSGGRSIEIKANSGPDGAPHRARVFYYAPPAEGFPLTVDLEGDGGLEIEAIAQLYALPEIAEPRPAYMMPDFGWTTDSTFVKSVHSWQPGMESEAPAETEDSNEVAAE